MLTGHQRSDEMEGARVHGSEVLLGVIPLVEDERDITDTIRKFPAAVCQLFGHAGKCHRVVLVASVGAMKQGDVAVGGYHQGQADDAQIVPPFFAMAPLGQFRSIVEAVDEGEEVGSIEKQASQIQAEVRHCGCGDLLLDLADRQLVDPIHVVPEPLAGQLRTLDAKQAGKHGLIVPFAGFRLAAGRHATVEAGHQEIFTDRRPLAPLLGSIAVEKGYNLELAGNIER